MIVGDHIGGWWHTGGSGPGSPGPTPGLDHRFNELPRAERGELQGWHWRKRAPLIYEYLPPSTLEHLMDLEEALTRFRDQHPRVLAEPHADISQSQNTFSQKFDNLMMELGLMNLLRHFQKCWWFRHIKKWYKARQSRLMRARGDYILTIYLHCFKMVGILGTRNYP